MRLQSVGNGIGGYSQQDSIQNAAPGISYTANPFSVGFWFSLNGAVSPTLWNMTGSSENETVGISGGVVGFSGTDSTGPNSFSINAATTVTTTGVWNYVLIRGVTTSNRWLSYYDGGTGKITHAQDVTTLAFAGATTLITCGPVNGPGANGAIGAVDMQEMWYADSDVQASPGQVLDEVLFELMYQGPFSVAPFLQGDVRILPVEYRSWRDHPFYQGRPSECFFRQDKGRQVWTNGVSTGSNPQASNQLVLPKMIRPGQTIMPPFVT